MPNKTNYDKTKTTIWIDKKTRAALRAVAEIRYPGVSKHVPVDRIIRDLIAMHDEVSGKAHDGK